MNSSKSSIYEDKIQTLRAGSKKENHVVISPENDEESRLAKEEEAVSRLLGDLSITDKKDEKTSSTTSKSSMIKNVILPLNESSDETHSSAAAIAAATSALSEDSKEKNLDMKAVSSKTRAKSSSAVEASPIPVATDMNAKEIEKLPPAVPKVVVKHRDNVSLGDFQGTSSSTVSSTR